MERRKLSEEEVNTALASLDGWELDDDKIERKFKFENFAEALAFVNKVGEIAEAADHHPDIHVNYTRVTFICSTHTDGGVSDKDIKLAGEIEKAFAAR